MKLQLISTGQVVRVIETYRMNFGAPQSVPCLSVCCFCFFLSCFYYLIFIFLILVFLIFLFFLFFEFFIFILIFLFCYLFVIGQSVLVIVIMNYIGFGLLYIGFFYSYFLSFSMMFFVRSSSWLVLQGFVFDSLSLCWLFGVFFGIFDIILDKL